MGDLVTVTLLILRSGRLALMSSAQATADTFCIEKKDGRRLRGIRSGGAITRAARKPCLPPLQCTPSASANLEANTDLLALMSSRDGKVFFDQLSTPRAVAACLGRPTVRLSDLMDPPLCESGAAAETGLTQDELSAMLLDGPLPTDTIWITPVCLTWPMGFGWNSFIAQSAMVKSCTDAGFNPWDFSTGERILSADSDSAVAVATDDVNVFNRLSPAMVAKLSEYPLDRLDRSWDRAGIQGNTLEFIDLATDGRVLGVDLRDGIRLQARGDKISAILSEFVGLAANPVCTPLSLAAFVGQLQWQCMLARPLFSCFNMVYDLVRRQPDSEDQPLTDGIMSELALCSSLFPLWSADLSRPWLSVLTATDASGNYGFGMCMSKCTPGLSRQIAAAAGEGDMVTRLEHSVGDPRELPRKGREFRLPLTIDDFSIVLSIKAEYDAHSRALEMEAVRLALLRLTRAQRRHGHRVIVLVDAKVVGSALRKGRTAALTIARGCKACGAIQLAADLKLSFAYLPSESKPVDWPSRNTVRKGHCKPVRRSKQVDSMSVHVRGVCRSLRRLRQCDMIV